MVRVGETNSIDYSTFLIVRIVDQAIDYSAE